MKISYSLSTARASAAGIVQTTGDDITDFQARTQLQLVF